MITLTILEQIHKSAETGKNYSTNQYDIERYSQIVALTKELYKQIDGFNDIQIDTLAEKSYLTPKVGVNAIIENEKGEFLLEKRMDDKKWGIIGGWCEVGFSPEENIIREVFEETGLKVEIEQQIGIVSRKPNQSVLYASYHIIYKCKILEGTIKKSHESEEVAWKQISKIKNWHYDHKNWFDIYCKKMR